MISMINGLGEGGQVAEKPHTSGIEWETPMVFCRFSLKAIKGYDLGPLGIYELWLVVLTFEAIFW
jgi:hypothetical protein